MEIYTLDSLFRRIDVIDNFQSLIWTERWAGWGDFELSIRSTPASRSMLIPDVFLSTDVAYSTMRIQTTEDTVDAEGLPILKVKGRSIESFFDDRLLAQKGMIDPGLIWFGVPVAFLTEMVNRFTSPTGVTNPLDAIPNLVMGRHPAIPASNIPEPVENVVKWYKPQNLYTAMTEFANTWNLGFRLLLNPDNGMVYFDVYTGVDRTTSQTTHGAVVFSPELDNIQNPTELNTVEDAKNVAFVIAQNESVEVYAPGILPDTDGYERKVIAVSPEGLDDMTGETLLSAMRQAGREELAKYRPLRAFDGEISQTSNYIYNKDYYLGDLVEIRNRDNVSNHMRVTEQIFVSDAEGFRSYPTLALNTFVGPGSWLSWPTDKKWIDYDVDVDTVWGTLP